MTRRTMVTLGLSLTLLIAIIIFIITWWLPKRKAAADEEARLIAEQNALALQKQLDEQERLRKENDSKETDEKDKGADKPPNPPSKPNPEYDALRGEFDAVVSDLSSQKSAQRIDQGSLDSRLKATAALNAKWEALKLASESINASNEVYGVLVPYKWSTGRYPPEFDKHNTGDESRSVAIKLYTPGPVASLEATGIALKRLGNLVKVLGPDDEISRLVLAGFEVGIVFAPNWDSIPQEDHGWLHKVFDEEIGGLASDATYIVTLKDKKDGQKVSDWAFSQASGGGVINPKAGHIWAIMDFSLSSMADILQSVYSVVDESHTENEAIIKDLTTRIGERTGVISTLEASRDTLKAQMIIAAGG